MEHLGLSRAQLVYNSTKELIRAGQLSPGTRLRETEIAERLGVSRTPVREAINRLLSEGLLTLDPTRGLIVVSLERQQVQEIYALREFLEGAAARYASQHASPLEIDALADMLARSKAIGNDPMRQSQLNKRFHAAIGTAAHNQFLEQALSRLADSLGLVPGTSFELKGRLREVHREHAKVLNAIRDRDPDGAEEAARAHIREAGRARLKLLFGDY